MNGTIKLDTATDIPGRTGNWATQGAVAAGRAWSCSGSRWPASCCGRCS